MVHRLLALTLLTTAPLLGLSGGVAHAASATHPCIEEPGPCGADPGVAVPHTPRALVSAYFGALQTGMATGDFSALTPLFASHATVTRNDPKGRSTTVRGLAQIARLYRQVRASSGGMQWTEDAMHRLSPTIILSYEHATGSALRIPERSSHLFVIRAGKITRLDDTTYYAGQR